MAGSQHRITRILGCAGLIPFVVPALLVALESEYSDLMISAAGAEYLLGWLPKGTHAWRKFVKPVELARLLDNHGLTVAETAGVRVNPLARHFSLGKGLAVNYMLSASRGGKTLSGG